jgi:hypothetical protein
MIEQRDEWVEKRRSQLSERMGSERNTSLSALASFLLSQSLKMNSGIRDDFPQPISHRDEGQEDKDTLPRTCFSLNDGTAMLTNMCRNHVSMRIHRKMARFQNVIGTRSLLRSPK